MPRGSDADLLDAFIADATLRIERLAEPGIAEAVPQDYSSAARSVARQARGGWTVALRDGDGFHLSCPMREFELGRTFGSQCGRIVDMVLASRDPALRRIVQHLGDTACDGILSAFFHYFMAHEFLHVEQGLGSEQYRDSDFYMPIVMEADYVADVAGLVIVLHASVPELAGLTQYDVLMLLIAIHIASMQSFRAPGSVDIDRYSFGRLVLWYMHFARFAKSGLYPTLESPSFQRAWVIAFPRLLASTDESVTHDLLTRREAEPFPAGSDVVLAYHGEDGMYRIHRAALTDSERVGRLCRAVIDATFDPVRLELEEVLVNNPALVPSVASARPADVEWAAGSVLEEIGRLRPTSVAADLVERLAGIRDGYVRLVAVARSDATPSALVNLLEEGTEMIENFVSVVAGMAESATASDIMKFQRRALSVVDQIAVAVTDAPSNDQSR